MPNASPPESVPLSAPLLSTDQCFHDYYAKLSQIARRLICKERPEHAEPPSALVHEAYLRLRRHREGWRNDRHFLARAAKVMSWVLVEAARARGCERRGSGARAVALRDVSLVTPPTRVEEMDVGPALVELARRSELKSRLAQLRSVHGLTIEESGRELSISSATVSREWRGALDILRQQMA